MKRHPSLAWLSREHHAALILSKLLQKNAPPYKGLPVDIPGKADYALKFYTEELIPHFESEEKVLHMVVGNNGKLYDLIQKILREHQELHELFKNIRDNPEIASHLDKIGRQLEIHVRTEERELFPLIEETCNEADLETIGKYLSSH